MFVYGHNGSCAPDKGAESAISQHGAYTSSSISQIQARETDIQALSELTLALDKKVVLLFMFTMYILSIYLTFCKRYN